LSAIENLSGNGLLGSVEVSVPETNKVKSLWAKSQLLIVLHSPHVVLETGLRLRLPERSEHRSALDAKQSFSAVRFVRE
jgi:hypothetical protein